MFSVASLISKVTIERLVTREQANFRYASRSFIMLGQVGIPRSSAQIKGNRIRKYIPDSRAF